MKSIARFGYLGRSLAVTLSSLLAISCAKIASQKEAKTAEEGSESRLAFQMPASFNVTFPARNQHVPHPTKVSFEEASGTASYEIRIHSSLPNCSSPNDARNRVSAQSLSPLSEHPNGIYTLNNVSLETDGEYFACVYAVNHGQIRGASNDPIRFVVDRVPPGSFEIDAASLPKRTKDGTPLVKWSLASGASSYEVRFADGSGATCDAPANRVFQTTSTPFSPPSALSDGPYRVCVSARDAAGNITEASNSGQIPITIDTVAPTPIIVSGQPDAFSNLNSLNVKVGGTDVAQYAFAIVNGSSCPAATAYSALRDVSALITGGIGSDGPKSLCIRARDEAGNFQSVNEAFRYSWVKDATGPALVLNGLPANPMAGTQLNVSASVSNETNASVAFELLKGSSCANATFPTVQALPSSIVMPLGDDDTLSLCAVARDSLGNPGPVRTVTFVKDTTPPAGAFSVTIPAAMSNDSTPLFSWQQLNDPRGPVRYELKIGASPTCESPIRPPSILSTTQYPSPLISDGSYFVCVSAVDSLGNRREAPPVAFTIDTIAPVAQITNGSPSEPSNLESLVITVKGDDVSEFQYAVTNANSCPTLVGSYSAFMPAGIVTIPIPGDDGIRSLCLRGKDLAGNPQPISAATKVTWVKDTKPPTIQIDGPRTPSAQSLEVALGDTSHYSLVLAQGMVDCSGASFSAPIPPASQLLTIDLSGMSDGPVTLCVKGRDIAGNFTIASRQWERNTVPPPSPTIGGVSSPTLADSITITWQALPGLGYTLNIDSVASCTSGNPVRNYPMLTVGSQVISGLSDGSYFVCLSVENLSGVKAVATNNGLPLVIDRVPPTASLVEVAPGGFPAHGSISNRTMLNVRVEGAGVSTYLAQVLTVPAGVTPSCANASYPGSARSVVEPIVDAIGADGAKILCVKGIDAAGNIQAVATSRRWTKDTSPPANVSLSGVPVLVSNQSNLEVNVLGGTDLAGYRHVLLSGAASCDGASYSSLRPKTERISTAIGADGAKLLCVMAEDAIGNSIVLSHAFNQDATPPGDFTLSSVPSPSRTQRPSFTWSAAQGANRYLLRISKQTTCIATGALHFDAGESLNAMVPNELAEGSYFACVVAQDGSGNSTISSIIPFVIDLTPPGAFSLTKPVAGQLFNSRSVKVAFVRSNDAVRYKLKIASDPNCYNYSTELNLNPNNPLDSSFEQTLTANADGVHHVCVIAYDAAGNWRDAASRVIQIDTVNPGAFHVLRPLGTVKEDAPEVAWSESADSVGYQLKIASDRDCSQIVQEHDDITTRNYTLPSLVNGTYYVCLSSRDAAGNSVRAIAENGDSDISFTVEGYRAPGNSITAMLNAADSASGIGFASDHLVGFTSLFNRTSRATIGKESGRWYFEARVLVANANSGLSSVGISTKGLPLTTYRPGEHDEGCGYRMDGKIFCGASSSLSPAHSGFSYGFNDVIGIAFDVANRKAHFFKNGERVTPIAGLNMGFDPLRPEFYPAVTLANSRYELNFGRTNLQHAPPQGFEPGVFDEKAPSGAITAAWNPLYKDTSITLTAPANLAATGSGQGGIVLANKRIDLAGEKTLKYFEVRVTKSDAPGMMIGVAGVTAESGPDFNSSPGLDSSGCSYRNNDGAIFCGGNPAPVLYGAPLVAGDVVQVAVEAEQNRGEVWFGLNGAWLHGDPRTTEGLFVGQNSSAVVPIVRLLQGTKVEANFGAKRFFFVVPAGFSYGIY